MDKNQSLQNLLNGTASEEDVELLKRLLASGEISIGGNVNQSVIIIGSGNTVELPPAALDRLNARSMLGNLDRDLTGEEIASGLRRLDKLLPNRAPVLLPHYKEQVGRLRPTLKTEIKSLSESARREHAEALAAINSICVEALDVSFNGLCLGEEAPKYDARSPFRGLESFRYEDREFFLGREALTQKLVGKIKAHSFLAVLGASGSGKSSLVMAGVIPALASDYAIFRPGTNPLGELESAHGKSLIVVDQFEELFTLTRDESTRKDFIARLLEESSRARIILTLRSDFLSEVGAYRTLSAEIQNHLEIVPPMDMDELRRAMEGQAGVVGLRFEADLSQQILDDVAGEPGAMPLLQHALWELWNRRHGRNLRASEYRAFGGVKQAITSTAEKVYAECSKAEQDQLRDVFLRLTRLDDNDEGRDTRRRVPLRDLIPFGRDAASITLLLDKLANARLVVKTINGDKTEIEVAHEALIRHWERLRLWLNEDRDALRLRESVSESAKEWERSGKYESLLNSRWVKLDEALLLAQDSRYRLTEVEQAYLKGCVALRNREQRERERRLRYTVFASIMTAIIFLTLGSFGWVKSNEATNQAATAQANLKIALARQIASQSQLLEVSTGENLVQSGLLAAESLKTYPSSEGYLALNRSLKLLPKQVSCLPQNDIMGFVFSLDGAEIITVHNDSTVRISNLQNGNDFLFYGDGRLDSFSFSEDSTLVAVSSCKEVDGMLCKVEEIRVLDVMNRYEISKINHYNEAFRIAISSKENLLASGNSDGSIQIWKIDTGKELAKIEHNGRIYALAFSPDGKYLVSGSEDNTARIWNTQTGEEVARMIHDGDVYNVAFSPDGRLVVTGGGDSTAHVWEAVSGIEISYVVHEIRPPRYSNVISFVAFNPNDNTVVSGSSDGRLMIWNAETGEIKNSFLHSDSIKSAEFSNDGKKMISSGSDDIVHIWSLETGEELGRMVFQKNIIGATFAPNSELIATAYWEDKVCLWNMTNGEEIRRFNHAGEVADMAMSLGGQFIVSGDRSGIAHLWEVPTGKEIIQIKHDDEVRNVAISSQGKWVVSRSRDGVAKVWSMSTHSVILSIGLKEVSPESGVSSFAFSPNEEFLVTGSWNGQVCVWDIFSAECVTQINHSESVYALTVSPNNKWVASSDNRGLIYVWDIKTGEIISTMMHDDGVDTVLFSPDGKRIITGSSDGTARVWDSGTGIEIFRMIHDDRVNVLSVSPDGELIATGSYDGTARVWSLSTHQELLRLKFSSGISVVAISPDGKWLAAGSWDGTVRILNIEKRQEVARIIHEGSVYALTFSYPDGKWIVSGSDDRTVRVWLWRPDDLIDEACRRLPRNLTFSEWQQFIGINIPYQVTCDPEIYPNAIIPDDAQEYLNTLIP